MTFSLPWATEELQSTSGREGLIEITQCPRVYYARLLAKFPSDLSRVAIRGKTGMPRLFLKRVSTHVEHIGDNRLGKRRKSEPAAETAQTRPCPGSYFRNLSFLVLA